MTAERIIRVGIIGLGRVVFNEALPQLMALPQLFQITTICDLEKERRDRALRMLPNVRAYLRYEELIDDHAVDLIYIAAPSLHHEKMVADVLASGKHVLVETPLAFTHTRANLLKSSSAKARELLLVAHHGLFAPDYLLAMKASTDTRLGELYDVRMRHQTYRRRDDWQTIRRCGGGITHYLLPDMLLQAIALTHSRPTQLWGDVKRIAAVGDVEDFAHVMLRSRANVTADIEINGGQLPPYEPSFTIRGSRGEFRVMPGASEGVFHVIDPAYKFPRRRSHMGPVALEPREEPLPMVDIPFSLPADTATGPRAFWQTVGEHIAHAASFPVSLEESVETVRYIQLIRQSTPLA